MTRRAQRAESARGSSTSTAGAKHNAASRYSCDIRGRRQGSSRSHASGPHPSCRGGGTWVPPRPPPTHLCHSWSTVQSSNPRVPVFLCSDKSDAGHERQLKPSRLPGVHLPGFCIQHSVRMCTGAGGDPSLLGWGGGGDGDGDLQSPSPIARSLTRPASPPSPIAQPPLRVVHVQRDLPAYRSAMDSPVSGKSAVPTRAIISTMLLKLVHR